MFTGSIVEMNDFATLEKICCGAQAPAECFLPAYVEHRMGPYYPKVEYFSGTAQGPLVYIEQPPVEESSSETSVETASL